jgi:Outer membrane protein beta-barrel domain
VQRALAAATAVIIFALMRTTYLALALTLSVAAFAQRSFHAVTLRGGFGSSTYAGDFNGGSMAAAASEARGHGALSLGFQLNSRWDVSAGLTYGSIYAKSTEGVNGFTGIDVRSTYLQPSLRVTNYALPYGRYWKRNATSPYWFAQLSSVVSQSQYATNVPYPGDTEFHEGSNYSAAYGGGIGVTHRMGEHWSWFTEGIIQTLPGDRLEGFTRPGQEGGDLLLQLRLGVQYSIYTWD